MTTGWTIGYVVGGVVVLLVVVLLTILIVTARKIGSQAEDIRMALEDTRIGTMPLWRVAQINRHIASITEGLRTARRVLGGGS